MNPAVCLGQDFFWVGCARIWPRWRLLFPFLVRIAGKAGRARPLPGRCHGYHEHFRSTNGPQLFYLSTGAMVFSLKGRVFSGKDNARHQQSRKVVGLLFTCRVVHLTVLKTTHCRHWTVSFRQGCMIWPPRFPLFLPLEWLVKKKKLYINKSTGQSRN